MKKKLILLGFMLLLCSFITQGSHRHRFGDWCFETMPTCAEYGIEARVCICGEVDLRQIPPSEAHTFGEWSACQYSVCPANQKEERICSVCSGREIRYAAVQGEHIYDKATVEKNATCTESGEIHLYCNCGEYKSEIIPAEHIIITEEAVFSTKTDTGFTKGVYCSSCNKVWQERKAVGTLVRQDREMLMGLGYEGDPKSGINLKWKLTEDSVEEIFGFIITVSSEHSAEKEKYTAFAQDGDWSFDGFSKSGKYTVEAYPVDKNGITANPMTVEINWYPEILEMDFPRIEITTLDGEIPDYKRVDHPEGCWGVGITDNEYVQSLVRIYDGDNNLLYQSSKRDFDEAKIKVRGNTSALGRKHPFKLKLGHKEDLLAGLVERKEGMDYRSKDWVLLSEGKRFNYVTGSAVADLVGCEWTPEYCYVVLFVNGDYRGLYILIESVDTGEERCNVSDDGYIVEMDSYWWNEELYFTTPISENSAAKLTFKYPDSDDITNSSPQYLYIKDYITQMEEILLSGGDVRSYIDYDSGVKWLLTHDILATYDSGGSNMYMTKYDSTENSKLMLGPLWDYGTVYSYEHDRFARIRSGKFFYMYLLVKDNAFMDMYRERYEKIRPFIVDALDKALEEYDNEMFDRLLSYEVKRWGSQITEASEERELSVNWMIKHLEWMDSKI